MVICQIWPRIKLQKHDKNVVEVLEVCDAANYASQLRGDFHDVGKKFPDLHSIINIT